MRTALLSAFVFLSLFIAGNVSAAGTGSTIINATVSGVMGLYLVPDSPEIVVPENYYFYGNLTVLQTNSQNISVYLNKSDSNNFVKFVNQTKNGTYYQDDYTLHLPNSHENVTLRIYVPPNQGYNGGTYNIPLYALSLNDYRSNTTTLKIHVNNTNPIDDIQIINLHPSTLYQGELLNADISVHKIYPSQTTDVQLCYCINSKSDYLCGPSYNNYGCEWKAISEWLNYTKTVTVNENPGNYYFIAAVEYPGDESIKRAVSPKFLVKNVPGPPGGGGAIILPSAPPQPQFSITAPDYLEAAPGESVTFYAEVKNRGNANALNTSLNVYGIPENWVSVTPSMQDMEVGKSKNYSVLITLPGEAYEQIYSLSLIAKSGDAEAIKIVTLTVAMSLENRAKFLLDEVRSKKKDAEAVINQAKILGIDTSEPEKGMVITAGTLDETRKLFESRNYEASVEKAKQAIEGYKAVINSVKRIAEELYLSLLNEVILELRTTELVAEEKDVITSISSKINQSMVLQKEDRVLEAYRVLLDAKQLLDQLKSKTYFKGLSQNIVIIAMAAIAIIVASAVVFYKKKVSRLMRTMKIEEYKKNLRSLFKREVRPDIPGRYYKEKPKEKPEEVKENIGRVRSFLKIGEALADTDMKGAKDAYIKAKEIYNSLSHEERKLAGEEIIRLNRLYASITRRKLR